jgi:hypothetical protein
MPRWLTALVLLTIPAALLCDEVALLEDFETEEALGRWQVVSGRAALVTEGVTQGQQALELTFDPGAQYSPGYLYWDRVPGDWSSYDALVLDVTNPAPTPLAGYLLVADKAWEEKNRSYWNRHNSSTTFPPGTSAWVIPVNGLYRGEAGSRNNDIPRNIDPGSIVRVDFGFGTKGEGGRVVIDGLRFVKMDRPVGIWAFDFGPSDQPVMLGWTPVAHDTAYSKESGYGWGPQGGNPWNGAARDTTFGTSLIQDFCEAGGYRFQVDVPPGRYRVTMVYENSGYWGGEQAKQANRAVYANDRLAWTQRRPDGAAHALYRFENVEPVGVDLWDTYMAAELAQQAVFEVDVADNGLNLRFEADAVFGSKIAAIALCPLEDVKARKWVDDQFAAVATEFRRRAACLDAPAAEYTPSAEWSAKGLVAWPLTLDEDIGPGSVPSAGAPAPGELVIRRLAARGEYEPFCLAVRPLRDLGQCHLELQRFSGPSTLAADLRMVWYNTSRGFGDIAYRVAPHTLRETVAAKLPAGIARQFVVTVRVPPEARPGEYVSTLAISGPAGEALLTVPLVLRVSPVTLSRETDFLMGFFGLEPPDLIPARQRPAVLVETLNLLAEYGMNAVSGGPDIVLTGWQNGQPTVDLQAVDDFVALLAKHGFTGGINGYGGLRFRGLHDHYVKGATGERVEQQSGLPYEEALMRAWALVHKHARSKGWPTIFYAMCDETRVRERAESELEFMQWMGRVSTAFPETVQTSGSYSVHFNARPESLDDMLTWHQRFFEHLDISSLNNHDASVMSAAARLKKAIHIYNQGISRYSFGVYQWGEYRKGVKARWQWHLNVLHGYQFFDLDGREPDTAMICYGRERIYPTIHFARCREGAEDFYLLNALQKALAAAPAPGHRSAVAKQAADLLKTLEAGVQINQREAPPGHDVDAVKRQVIEALVALSAD